MSYVLDGIKTAMELRFEQYRHVDDPGGYWNLYCPCGAERLNQNDLPGLRFHYTHCPQAKVVPKRSNPWSQCVGRLAASP